MARYAIVGYVGGARGMLSRSSVKWSVTIIAGCALVHMTHVGYFLVVHVGYVCRLVHVQLHDIFVMRAERL
jgi:hypothetical protein